MRIALHPNRFSLYFAAHFPPSMFSLTLPFHLLFLLGGDDDDGTGSGSGSGTGDDDDGFILGDDDDEFMSDETEDDNELAIPTEDDI